MSRTSSVMRSGDHGGVITSLMLRLVHAGQPLEHHLRLLDDVGPAGHAGLVSVISMSTWRLSLVMMPYTRPEIDDVDRSTRDR